MQKIDKRIKLYELKSAYFKYFRDPKNLAELKRKIDEEVVGKHFLIELKDYSSNEEIIETILFKLKMFNHKKSNIRYTSQNIKYHDLLYLEFEKYYCKNILYNEFPKFNRDYVDSIFSFYHSRLVTEVFYSFYTYEDYLIKCAENHNIDLYLKYKVPFKYSNNSKKNKEELNESNFFAFSPLQYAGYLIHILKFLEITPSDYNDCLSKCLDNKIQYNFKFRKIYEDYNPLISFDMDFVEYILKNHSDQLFLLSKMKLSDFVKKIINSDKEITFQKDSWCGFIHSVEHEIGFITKTIRDKTINIKDIEISYSNETIFNKVFKNTEVTYKLI
jgi:hypothetical protein